MARQRHQLRKGFVMTISAHMHGFKRLEARQSGATSWLTVHGGTSIGTVSIFMDYRLAQALEAAFHAYEDEIGGQEGPTFDEALGAKCDAAALTEIRKLTGAA